MIVSFDDVCKLLDIVGHADDWASVDTRNLVCDVLYPAFDGMEGGEVRELEIKADDLYLIHRYFTPTAWGQGGREFQCKLAHAITLLSNVTALGEIAEMTVGGEDEDLPEAYTEAETREMIRRMENSDA